MDIEKFLNSEEVYQNVYDTLSKHFDGSLISASKKIEGTNKEKWGLPSSLDIEGFIAGGSVANIINHLINGGKEPVVRDIDIFFSCGRKNLFKKSNSNEFLNKSVDTTPFNVESGWYGGFNTSRNGAYIRVTGHYREHILNYVSLKVKNNNNYYLGDIILNTFDLNCCQAGLDIENKKIIYTKNFIEFLKTKEILVTKIISPIQTTIRLKKKVEDLGCYCNFDREIGLLQHSCIFPEHINNQFGEETYEKYLANKEFVDRYFNIVKTKYKSELFGGSIYKYDDIDLWLFEPNLDDYKINFEFKTPKELIGYWRLFKFDLGKTKKEKIKRLINHIYSKGVHKRDPNDIHKRNYNVTEVSISNYNTSDYYKNGLYFLSKIKEHKVHRIKNPLWDFLLNNEKYYDCDFHIKHLKEIENFYKEHPSIFKIFNILEHNLTIQNQLELIRFIKTMSRQKGLWIIGELETIDHFKVFEMGNLDNIKKQIEDYVSSREKDFSEPLTIELNLDSFKYKDNVKELTTTIDLMSEGKMMGHCVGGYSNQIKNGNSRIFHIECGGFGSTIEISTGMNSNWWWGFEKVPETPIPKEWELFADKELINEYKQLCSEISSKKYSITQHYGRYPDKGNLTPTEENQKIANSLLSYLNEQHITENMLDSLKKKFIIEEKIKDNVIINKQREREKLNE